MPTGRLQGGWGHRGCHRRDFRLPRGWKLLLGFRRHLPPVPGQLHPLFALGNCNCPYNAHMPSVPLSAFFESQFGRFFLIADGRTLANVCAECRQGYSDAWNCIVQGGVNKDLQWPNWASFSPAPPQGCCKPLRRSLLTFGACHDTHTHRP